MTPQRFPPDDPREWLNRARSNLARARADRNLLDVYLEDLCFDAQQAAEKALKGLLIALRVRFHHTHDLADLLSLAANAGLEVPDKVASVAELTVYAVVTRYPGAAEPLTDADHQRAVAVADFVVMWAENEIRRRRSG